MTNFENKHFFDEDALLDRLSDGLRETPKEVVFVVGAPLTAPEKDGSPGVSSVSEIVNDIRGRFAPDTNARQHFENKVINASNKYQEAFHFLQGRRGQGICNEVVRDAVLKARREIDTAPNASIAGGQLSEEQLREFDTDDFGWHLTKGVEALGQLIALQPSFFGKTLLTSNFDPLAEVAVRAAGGSVWQTKLAGDADLSNTDAPGCRIVHFHGYWIGSDTLHTGAQLLQNRPSLKSSLLEYLRDKLVVIVAYGGWEDILTSALRDLSGNSSVFPEVLWAFYDTTPAIPSHLRNVLQPGVDRGRTSLYAGINCHQFFPKLLNLWQDTSQKTDLPVADTSPAFAISITLATLKQLECDRPPNIDAWVGREAELRSLEITRSSVVIITGIGGQGKSLIAAKHIRSSFESNSNYRYWDWRDCKESADSIRTQIIAAIDRITSEEITSEMLADVSDVDLAEIFVEYAADSKTIFVFDNVDHYVDLVNFRFVGILDSIIKKFALSDTNSQIILTCRPQVKYTESSVISISMPGLTLGETRELFEQRGVELKVLDSAELTAVHDMTEGHPFWLDLIAVQVAQVPGTTLSGLMEDIRRGREDSPNILSSIWERLAEREQVLLRVMAEAVRPETKETIEKYASSKLRYNKFEKALRTLIRLNLVTVKPEVNAPDLYDLHPLVRQFVKQNFVYSERIDYIRSLISQYENMLKSMEKVLGFSLPLPLLGRWTQKAELDIAAHQYAEAVESLNSATDALIGGGHSEEFVRVSRELLEAVDWDQASTEISGFDKLVGRFVECLDDLGDYAGADQILERFSLTIPEKTARYIRYCDMKCYSYWKRGDFGEAIKWGQNGVELKRLSNVDTAYETEHNLALARRDSGDIEPALEYFLRNSELEKLLDPKSDHKIEDGPTLGNVGRCLQLQGRIDEALVCYKKSIRALLRDDDSMRLSNEAYACQWIAECLIEVSEERTALAFVTVAEDILVKISPTRARGLSGLKQKVFVLISDRSYSIRLADANRQVKKWIDS